MAAKKSGTATRSKGQASMARAKKSATAPSSVGKKSQKEQAKAANKKNTLAWKSRLNAEYALFDSLEERRKVVQRAIRGIYAYLGDMVHSNIDLAGDGNYSAAKFLIEFAGIDDLAGLILAEIAITNSAQTPPRPETKVAVEDDDDPTKAVLSFYKKLGMTPPRLKPPKAVQNTEEEAAVQPAM